MKKNIIATMLCLTMIIAICMSFASCDSNDSIEIKVFLKGSETPRTIITKESGESFLSKEYMESVQTLDDSRMYLGLYVDKDCKIKYDDTIRLVEDLILYVDYRLMFNATTVKFVYEGDAYCIFREQNDVLTVNDFIISAYGMPMDGKTVEFYADCLMTKPLAYEGNKLSAIENIEVSVSFDAHEYTIYVKAI